MEGRIQTPSEFLSTLDLSKMDPEVAQFITEELLPHDKLKSLSADSREYKRLYSLINTTYPFASIQYAQSDEGATELNLGQLQHNLKQINIALERDPLNKTLLQRKKLITFMIQKASA